MRVALPTLIHLLKRFSMTELKLQESGSSIGTFMDCPKKYEFSYIKKLSSSRYPQTLVYGSLIHAWIEDITENCKGSRQLSVETTLQRCTKDFPQEENLQRLKLDAALAKDVAALWWEFWKGRDGDLSPKAYDIIQSEREWNFTLPGLHLMKHLGKSDGVIKHNTYNKHFLYELKTSGDPNRELYKHKLELDKQINSNLIAMKIDGFDPGGVIYDIIWKPAIRIKKDRKTMPDETQEEFNARIVECYKNEPEKYFERLMVFRSEKDIEEYKLDLVEQYAALRGVYERGHFYRNTNSCQKFGSMCQFFNLCLDTNVSEIEDTFVVRKDKLPELSSQIQEI